MVFLPVKDGMAKILASTCPPLEIIWAQFLLMHLLLAPLIISRYGAGGLRRVVDVGNVNPTAFLELAHWQRRDYCGFA